MVFYDGQVENAERLCVELAVDAAAAGAVIATKTRVDAPLVERGRVVGVRATDTLTGEQLDIRGFVTYNVAGAAIDRLVADPSLPEAAATQRWHQGVPPHRRIRSRARRPMSSTTSPARTADSC